MGVSLCFLGGGGEYGYGSGECGGDGGSGGKCGGGDDGDRGGVGRGTSCGGIKDGRQFT